VLADDEILAEAEVLRGCALNQLGDLEEGTRVLQAAIPVAEAVNDLTSLVHALNDLGFLYEIGGEFDRSRVYKLRALDIAERVGDPAAIANMTFRYGQNAFLLGDWRVARESFDRSLALARQIDASAILPYPLFGLGLLALARCDGEAVVQYAEECLTIATRTEDVQILRAGHSLLAEQDLEDGRPEIARARLQALKPDEEGLDLRSILPTLAEACLMMGDLDAAHTYIADGVTKATTSHSRVGLVEVLLVQALALMAQERRQEGAAVLDEALRLARAMPYPYAVARLLSVDSLWHICAGQEPQARQKLDEANAVFHRLGAVRPLRLAAGVAGVADPGALSRAYAREG
jgi:tetratricopeptide (TPR) repeat protein